jgi:hypothetical protein
VLPGEKETSAPKLIPELCKNVEREDKLWWKRAHVDRRVGKDIGAVDLVSWNLVFYKDQLKIGKNLRKGGEISSLEIGA